MLGPAGRVYIPIHTPVPSSFWSHHSSSQRHVEHTSNQPEEEMPAGVQRAHHSYVIVHN